jgi:hypothetical protein
MTYQLRHHESFPARINPFSREFRDMLNLMASEISALAELKEAIEARLAIPLEHPKAGGAAGDFHLCVIDDTHGATNATYDVHLVRDPNIVLLNQPPLLRPVNPDDNLVEPAPPFTGEPGQQSALASLGMMVNLGPLATDPDNPYVLVVIFGEWAQSVPCPAQP